MPIQGDTPFIRASFSIATEEQIDIALQRLSELLKGD
jgi:DNA-binding transcriptional MocR family regulator